MYLSELKPGEVAKVLKLEIEDKKLKRHLLDMGLTRGVKVQIKKSSPMGDPIDIILRDYELCISKSDLKKVKVEKYEDSSSR